MVDPEIRDYRLHDYIALVRKHRGVVGAVFLVILLVGTLGTLVQDPQYRAISTIRIRAHEDQVVDFTQVTDPTGGTFYDREKFYRTQYEILRSRALRRRVLQDLPSRGITRFQGTPGSNFILSQMIFVHPVKQTELVQLRVTSNDPVEAREIANSLAAVYESYAGEALDEASERAFNWVEERLGDYEDEVQRHRERVSDYIRENQIVDIAEHHDLATEQLIRITDALAELKTNEVQQVVELEHLRRMRRTADTATLVIGLESPLVTRLWEERNTLQSELDAARVRYLDNHPTVQQLDARLTALERRVRSELDSHLEARDSRLATVRAQIGALETELAGATAEVTRLEEILTRYRELREDAERNTEFRTYLAERLDEIDLTKALPSSPVSLVDPAVAPNKPFRPNLGLNILLSAVVGLLGGVGVAFAIEFFDATVKSQKDIEQGLKLPVLGLLPLVDGEQEAELDPGEFYISRYPRSRLAESCRGIRTNLLFRSTQGEIKSILVTSPGVGEGKTTVSINLAIIMAEAGSRILLVDTDLRRPRVHKAFGQERGTGLVDILSGMTTPRRAIQETTVENLHLLTCGSYTGNPSELLESAAFARLVEDLEGMYDLVIFDSSPTSAVTDPVVIGQVVDTALLVVRMRATRRDHLVAARRDLLGVEASILGVVCNALDSHRDGYYYNYYYYSSNYLPDPEDVPPEHKDQAAS